MSDFTINGPLVLFLFSYFTSFLQMTFIPRSRRAVFCSLFCRLSPNLLDNSDQVTSQMKALQPGLLKAQFILKALCILTVKMDIPYEVSLWLNFAVSSLRSSTFCSLKHTRAHTHTHTPPHEPVQHIVIGVSTIRPIDRVCVSPGDKLWEELKHVPG